MANIPSTNACGSQWVENVDSRWNVSILQCRACHSITVAEAIVYLKQEGTRFSGSDWKYGWPHKFYIEPLNPNADQIVENGSSSGPAIDGSHADDYWTCFAHGSTHGRLNSTPTRFPDCSCPRERAIGFWSRPSKGKYPRLYTKLYSKHIKDATDAEFGEFAELSKKTFGILWERDEAGVKWSAPKSNSFDGFQMYGSITTEGVRHGLD
jgi:hypothetical protein